MTQCFVAFSVAAVMTAIFAFRFQAWTRPKALCCYFALFFILEYVCERLWLPPDTLGIGVGVVCLVLAGLFALASWLVHRFGGFG